MIVIVAVLRWDDRLYKTGAYPPRSANFQGRTRDGTNFKVGFFLSLGKTSLLIFTDPRNIRLACLGTGVRIYGTCQNAGLTSKVDTYNQYKAIKSRRGRKVKRPDGTQQNLGSHIRYNPHWIADRPVWLDP